ncbi:MAG: outer membrane lipoprotein carrier protein LolA [Bacteroidales bacterium]|nr:outer membrane lipoprotein carrier protein LolA [Bacteroidales bacterium]
MKKFVPLLLLALFATTLSAQITHAASGDVDEAAAAILKKASDQLNGKAVSFSVTMVNKNSDKKETARMDARVVYHKGKYRVEQDRQVLYSDGKALWHWNKDVGEVTVNNLSDGEDDLLNPARLLANYKKNFREKFIRVEQDGTAVIDLTPKKSKSYHKIRILVGEKTGVIKSMELHNYDGSRGEYRVSNFKQGVKTSDKDFRFDQQANPAVEVIDMR